MRVIAAGLVLALFGCGGDATRPVVVGSKNFTEQVILGEVIAALLEAEGTPVEKKLNLGGTFICHQAIVAGDIDVYVEYTGTALAAILKERVSTDPKAVLAIVKKEYAERFGLEWAPPLGFNNTFAMVMRASQAQALGIRTISDLAPHAKTLRTGFGYEFLEREDGLGGLTKAYGLDFAIRPREMELSLIYPALSQNEVDLVAGNATDGLIDALGLTILEDDRRYFPPYDAVPVVRPDTMTRAPRLRTALEKLGGKITDATMRELNRAVDSDHRAPRDVAREWVAKIAQQP